MDPHRNRWTDQPHAHAGERARRLRQLRALIRRDMALAEQALAEAAVFVGAGAVGSAFATAAADSHGDSPLRGGSHLSGD